MHLLLRPLIIGCLAVLGLMPARAADAPAAPVAPPAPSSFKFDFGGQAAPGYTAVKPTTVYSKESGFGFDLGTTPTAVGQAGGDPLRDGFVTSD